MKKKVKKMAFGGPSIFGPKTVAALKSAPASGSFPPKGTTQPGSPPTTTQSNMQQMQQAQKMDQLSGAMGANRAASGDFSVRPPGTAMSPPVKTGPVAPAGSAGMQNAAMKAYEQYKNMPSTTTAGPQSAQTGGIKLVNSPLASLAGLAAKRGFMKKGGSVKASNMGKVKQAKPSMGSASSRGDGIAQRGKTKGRMV